MDLPSLSMTPDGADVPVTPQAPWLSRFYSGKRTGRLPVCTAWDSKQRSKETGKGRREGLEKPIAEGCQTRYSAEAPIRSEEGMRSNAKLPCFSRCTLVPIDPPGSLLVHEIVHLSIPAIDVFPFPRFLRDPIKAPSASNLRSGNPVRTHRDARKNVIAAKAPVLSE